MKTKSEIIALINTGIKGQGNQVDLGSVLPEILETLVAELPDALIFTNVGNDVATIKIGAIEEGAQLANEKNFQYNIGNGWQKYVEETEISLQPNERVAFRALDNETFAGYDTDDGTFRKFFTTGNVSVKGSVESMGKMGNNGYNGMFVECSIINAPELPATELAEGCYSFMFSGCTSLVNAPELPATTLADSCYYEMFKDCSSLEKIIALFTTTPRAVYTNNWVQNVSPTGVFTKSANASWNVTGNNGVPTGWTIETR